MGEASASKQSSSATAGGGLAIEGQTSGITLTPPRPVTVKSHSLAALDGSFVTKSSDLASPFVALVGALVTCPATVTPFTRRAGDTGDLSPSRQCWCVSIWRPGCTSQDIDIDRIRYGSMNLFDSSTAAVQEAAGIVAYQAIDSSSACRARTSWPRIEILLPRCGTPRDASISSILSCITGCLFGDASTYQTPWPRRMACCRHVHGNPYISFSECLLRLTSPCLHCQLSYPQAEFGYR